MRNAAAEPIADDSDWLSAHIMLPATTSDLAGPSGDGVALDIILPFVDRCRQDASIDRFFFIRYWEGGPHLRLRLHGSRGRLAEHVRPALIHHIGAASPDCRIEGENRAGSATRLVASLHWVDYVPETQRYGGPRGLPIAEAFFHASSEAALRLLNSIRGKPRSTRLGLSLLCMVAIAHECDADRERAAAFFERYYTGFPAAVERRDRRGSDLRNRAFREGFGRQEQSLSAYVDEAWSRLDHGEPVSVAIDKLVAGASDAFAALRATDAVPVSSPMVAIASSYIHMMNNRMGVSNVEESYLSYLCTHALSAADATS